MARTEVTGRQIKDKSVSLADDVVDILPVTNGGSGVATLASGSVLIGAGTNPVGVVFPGTSGNVLTSNGSTWTSGTLSNIAQSSVTNLTTDLAGKEPAITAGTTSQYYRGDKSFQTLNKTAVGLANVDNTSDANKPVSTATQTALNAKEATANKGVANGYASLDSSARVPIAQLPPGVAVDSVTRTDGYIQFFSGATAVGSPIFLDFDVLDGGTASSTSVSTFDGGTP